MYKFILFFLKKNKLKTAANDYIESVHGSFALVFNAFQHTWKV